MTATEAGTSRRVAEPVGQVVPGGVVPVVETPFRQDGSVDIESFDRLVQYLMASGADGLMYAGFASEFVKLDRPERLEMESLLLSRTREAAGFVGLVSVTEHATRLAIEHAQWAVEHGADALNLLPPYLMQPSPKSVIEHVRQVLLAVRHTPVVIQVAPGLTGSALTAEELMTLAAAHANLAAVKVEAVPPGRMTERLVAQGMPCLVGYAGLYLPDALARGASGVQPGCSFIELYLCLWQRWTSGDQDGFRQLHEAMSPFLLSWMHDAELIVAVEKLISYERGLISSSYCREPGYRLDAHERASVSRFLTQFGSMIPHLTARPDLPSSTTRPHREAPCEPTT